MRALRARRIFACGVVLASVVAFPPFALRASAAERTVTLAEAEHAAMSLQPQLMAARAASSAAESRADEARAAMLPQVTATAQYLRQTGNFVPRPGSVPSSLGGGGAGWDLGTSYDSWSFGVTGTQLLYDFGQASGRYHSASATADSQRAAEATARLQVLFTVRRAYYGARAQKALVVVAQETLDSQQKHLMQVQGFVVAGTHPEIDLVQQRAAVANARVALITAQNNYETAKAQLNQAAGIAGGTEYDVGDEEAPPIADEDAPLEALVAKAIAARPELAAIAKQRVAQQETVGAVRGAYGPTLSATAGASEAGTALTGLVPNWNAGLLLSWPVLQGGLTRAQVREAEAGLASVDAQRSIEELQVRLDVDSARLAVRSAKATIGAAGEAVDSAREQLRFAEGRYTTGVGSIIELFDAQVAYTSAAAQLVQARFGLASARAQLLAALGRS
jgi:outer membrane protein